VNAVSESFSLLT